MALVVAEMVERRVAALVFLVDQHRMALRKRAALGILSRQPDVAPFLQQRTERQRLAGRPVDADAVVDGFGAVFQEALDGAVNPKTVRYLGDLAPDILEDVDVDAGDAAAGFLFLIGGLEAGPLAVEPVCLVGLVAGTRLELVLKPRAPACRRLIEGVLRHNTIGY